VAVSGVFELIAPQRTFLWVFFFFSPSPFLTLLTFFLTADRGAAEDGGASPGGGPAGGPPIGTWPVSAGGAIGGGPEVVAFFFFTFFFTLGFE